MKKVTKVLSTLLPSVFVLGLALGALPLGNALSLKDDPGEDTALYYDDEAVVDYSNPKQYAEEEDEDEEVTVEVDYLKLHYYDPDTNYNDRAFYVWVTGVDGVEYNIQTDDPAVHHNPDDVLVNEGEVLTLTMDFSTEEFKAFKNRSGMYFIVKFAAKSKTNLNWGGQSDDMYIRYADYESSVKDKKLELWTMPAAGGGIAILDSYEKTQVHGVALAQFTDWNTIHCTLTKDTHTVNWKLYAYDQTYFKIKPKKRAEAQRWYLVKEGTGSGNFDIKFKYEAHINMVYSLETHDPSTDSDPVMASLSKTVTVSFDLLYDTAKFHKYYEEAHAGTTLGLIYDGNTAVFKVWSPISANLKLLVYNKDTTAEYAPVGTSEDEKKEYGKFDAFQMQYTTGGIWEIKFENAQDLEGKYYNFQVDNVLGTNVTMDPYATSAGANGLRALIYNKNGSKVTPQGWNDVPAKWDGVSGYDIETPQELSIYEVHIQDFTGDASWNGPAEERGTYNGFVHEGTRLAGESGNEFWKKTGYDHLKELGFKAVQLMPTFDHDNNEVPLAGQEKYNWGYNPLNYNIPEGAYSSNAHDGYARVNEFKNLVMKMAQVRSGTDDIHTRVIMDVVYNHVSSATGSNFHKLMPRYYFRYAMKDYYNDKGEVRQKKGELWDGSGCHNEVASERPMMRKFIVESLCMWARDYKIKGFRFDLMGLIDWNTMEAAKKALYQIDPDIYLYGEGWDGYGGYHGEGSNEYIEYYGESKNDNYGSYTWHVYNKLNKFHNGTTKVKDEVYVGCFNSSYRNALRGDNDRGWGGDKKPGKTGWVQNGNWSTGSFNTEQINNIIAGLYGCNYEIESGVESGGTIKSARFPEQTISYASCHDNWTLRDQLYISLMERDDKPVSPDEIADVVMRASIETHSLIMASNSAALMLGGEELFRSKAITTPDDTPEQKAAKLAQVPDSSSYIDEAYGYHLSHNSYNSPLFVNGFNWNNKKSITVKTIKDDVLHTSSISYAGQKYVDYFKKLVRMHDKASLNFKQSPNENVKDVGTFIGNYYENLYWGRDGSSQVGNTVFINVNEVLICCHVGMGHNEDGNWAACGMTLHDPFINYGFPVSEDPTTHQPLPNDRYQPADGHYKQAWPNAIYIAKHD